MSEPELNFSSPTVAMQLQSRVRVSKPLGSSGRLLVRWHEVSALWDTGAVTSGITRGIAEAMGLKVRERAILSTPAGMLTCAKDIVLLDLMMDGYVIPVKVAVVESIPGQHGFLIGMDVISYGDFSVSVDNDRHRFNVRFKPYPGVFRTVEDIFKIPR